jgi:hypothetical protein
VSSINHEESLPTLESLITHLYKPKK